VARGYLENPGKQCLILMQYTLPFHESGKPRISTCSVCPQVLETRSSRKYEWGS
jgi:hypothetical protein